MLLGIKGTASGEEMVKFRIGYLGEKDNIVVLIERPEFGFAFPVIWFVSWEDFVAFRDMMEEFYQRAGNLPHQAESQVPDVFLHAFDDKDNLPPA